jgi:Spy/CpxP family protein refolding chaperone
MYPGFMHHWKARRCAERRAYAGGYGAEGESRRERWAAMAGDDDAPFGFGGHFGVRRPLRFLAYRLDLDDAQVAELAKILDEIKTERAQAAVDHRRALSSFAEAIAGESFDEAKAKAGAELRLQSAGRLRDAVVTALGRLHRLLEPEQRERLAYLVRTGTLSF